MPGLTSLTRGLYSSLNERKSDAVLFELNERDDTIVDYRAFQYFPESISDTKAINFQQKEIPGGSLPLYQWVSSGERLLSFTAQFTADVDLRDGGEDLVRRLEKQGAGRRNVDIRSAVVWLRRFMLPRYGVNDEVSAALGTGVPITFAPRKVRLHLPGSGIGLSGGVATNLSGSSLVDSVTCVMTQCDVTYESFFVSGLPQIVNVQLAFAQVPQLGGRVRFPSATQELDAELDGEGTQISFFGYKIRPRVLEVEGGED